MSLNTTYKPQWELLDFQNNPEYELFKSSINEFTQIAGFPIQYYVKLDEPESTTDTLWGENPISEFSRGYKTKMIYDPTDETQILDAMGITSEDTIEYGQLPKELFERDIEDGYLDDYPTEKELLPKVGDCIRTLWNNKLYELVDKGAESKIFQAQKLIWEFVLRPYRNSQESDSVHDMVFEDINDEDFPDINLTTESTELSAHGDNSEIEDQSDDIVDYDSDTSFFGYDTI